MTKLSVSLAIALVFSTPAFAEDARMADVAREHIFELADDREAAEFLSNGYYAYQVNEYCKAAGMRPEASDDMDKMIMALRPLQDISGLLPEKLEQLWAANRIIAVERLEAAKKPGQQEQCRATAGVADSLLKFVMDRQSEEAARVKPRDTITESNPF